MLSIESLSVDALREMAAYLLDRARRKEESAFMRDVIRDQVRNPVTAETPAPRVTVATGTTVTAGRSIDDWRPPGIGIIDQMAPTFNRRKM
jgi:hypothetical protein